MTPDYYTYYDVFFIARTKFNEAKEPDSQSEIAISLVQRLKDDGIPAEDASQIMEMEILIDTQWNYHNKADDISFRRSVKNALGLNKKPG